MSDASPKEVPARPGTDLFSEDAAASVLLPCNRESALPLLAALCVGDVPPCEVDLPKIDGHLALIPDGLRTEEGAVLSAGDPRRFPVLLEIPRDAVRQDLCGPWIVRTGELKGIVFQSQKDADDFRFRPVDEVNTEMLPVTVDPLRFGLPGSSRLALEHVEPTTASIHSDRVAAAIHCAIKVAEGHPALRPAVLKLFDHSAAASTAGEAPTFCDFCAVLFGGAQTSSLVGNVAAAFAGGGSAQEIVSAISAAQRDDGKVQAWAAVARNVLQNRVELSDSLLSDEGRVLLRGAILALAADTPRALDKFLQGERTSGPTVTVLAAFLGGLRRGVLNMSWSDKVSNAQSLSRLTAALLSRTANADGRHLPRSEVRRVGRSAAVQITIEGVSLCEWPVESSAPAAALREPLEKEGFEVVGAGETPESVLFALGEYRSEAVVRSDGLCVLKVFADPARKLRKKSEITEAFKNGGALWYPGPLEEERKFLFCDLPHLPTASERELLASRLADAFKNLLAPEKAKRSRKSPANKPKRSRTSKTAAQGPFTAD